MNYSETLHYLFTSLPVFQHIGGSAYKPGLQTARELDAFYGYPHRKYKTIHIAGTNGKGSVAHMIAAVLQGSGYNTGLFTSPHLEDFRERIRINGEMISEQEVIDFVKQSRDIFEKVQPSFFEMTTAMAFDHFARNQVDIAVIETGMGGRLDSTNIIHPVLSVITNVSMDHTQFLGNNLISIATEKAGIIKKKVPVVIGETQAGVAEVFTDRAHELDAPIIFADQLVFVHETEYNMDHQTLMIGRKNSELLLPVTIDLPGDYQRKNMVTGLVALECLDKYAGIPPAYDRILPSLEKAAASTGLRGRWQVLNTTPLMVCDAAHNAAGLSWVVRQIEKTPYEQLHMVIGFVKDKDIAEMLNLLPKGATYYFTKADIERALDEEELKAKGSEAGLYGDSFSHVADAIDSALENAGKNDFIFIGGSIFVIAEALKSVED